MNRMLVVGVVLAMLSLPARGAPPEAATQVIVLGVDHAAQLVAREDRPAVLATRLDLLQGRISRAEAIGRYKQIAAAAGEARFTWTGVKDVRRLDSWFDPFGNLSVRQRAHLELARESILAGRPAEADRLRTALGRELTARQRRQLDGYWPLLAK